MTASTAFSAMPPHKAAADPMNAEMTKVARDTTMAMVRDLPKP